MAGGNVKGMATFGVSKGVSFLQELSIYLPYNSILPLPRKMQIYVHTNTYTDTFTAALYIVAKKVETSQMPTNL